MQPVTSGLQRQTYTKAEQTYPEGIYFGSATVSLAMLTVFTLEWSLSYCFVCYWPSPRVQKAVKSRGMRCGS